VQTSQKSLNGLIAQSQTILGSLEHDLFWPPIDMFAPFSICRVLLQNVQCGRSLFGEKVLRTMIAPQPVLGKISGLADPDPLLTRAYYALWDVSSIIGLRSSRGCRPSPGPAASKGLRVILAG